MYVLVCMCVCVCVCVCVLLCMRGGLVISVFDIRWVGCHCLLLYFLLLAERYHTLRDAIYMFHVIWSITYPIFLEKLDLVNDQMNNKHPNVQIEIYGIITLRFGLKRWGSSVGEELLYCSVIHIQVGYKSILLNFRKGSPTFLPLLFSKFSKSKSHKLRPFKPYSKIRTNWIVLNKDHFQPAAYLKKKKNPKPAFTSRTQMMFFCDFFAYFLLHGE